MLSFSDLLAHGTETDQINETIAETTQSALVVSEEQQELAEFYRATQMANKRDVRVFDDEVTARMWLQVPVHQPSPSTTHQVTA